MNLTALYCDVDDFVKDKMTLQSQRQISIKTTKKKTGPKRRMSLAEIMTIIIYYHSSNFKNFKSYYFYLATHGKRDFPDLYSYTRFIELIPACLLPLILYLNARKGKVTGISFIDSTALKVCHNIRIKRNKVFRGIAERGKTSMGWFYGFKLHLIVNECGDLLSFAITKGHVDDRVPTKRLCRNLSGKLYGDKGYLGNKLFRELFARGVQLITHVKSNMKNKLMHLHDKLMLRKRFIIETINDQLKNISDIEHSRHRSPVNFLSNIISGLIAYTWQEKRPSIRGVQKKVTLA